MFALILIVLVGLGITLFSQQNTETVPLAVASYYFPAVPVYLIVISSMLFGLIIAWVLSILNFFSTSLLLRRKEAVIHDTQKTAADLEERVHELEQENARLRGERPDLIESPTETEAQPGFLERMRERLALHERKEALR